MCGQAMPIIVRPLTCFFILHNRLHNAQKLLFTTLPNLIQLFQLFLRASLSFLTIFLANIFSCWQTLCLFYALSSYCKITNSHGDHIILFLNPLAHYFLLMRYLLRSIECSYATTHLGLLD